MNVTYYVKFHSFGKFFACNY